MDADEAREFIRSNSRAVLATFRRDGGVQMSPVDGVVDADGYVVVSSRETAMKVRNLQRNPRATLCVFTESFYGPWVYVEGDAELVQLPEAMEGLVDYYRRAKGEHPDWDEYRQAMVDDRRLLIRIPIERAGPSVAG
ncbi:MAG TPA: PPOX class F420-dependent oxidoreductase [Egibacteraceae bacterium]|nr:PPOX class F420-dependent oxidoreductase [Egibacteraceae bacterium]